MFSSPGTKIKNYFTYGGMCLGAALCFYKVSIERSMPFEIMPIMTVICVSAAFGAVIGFVVQRIKDNEDNN
ncbi:MAG: hypothetical protein ACO3MW_12225 [Rhodospirillales bacterium]|jgi:hypothetical protein